MIKLNKFLIASALLANTFFAYAVGTDHLRGQRYCEIFVNEGSVLAKKIRVYNTIGLNNCPQSIWNKITTDEIKKETNASFVHLNGPRYWVIDAIQNAAFVDPEKKTLGGLEMRDVGTLELSFKNIVKANKPYTDNQVERQTTWVYLAKKPVYELIAPNGNIYIMQSYSVQKIPQTQKDLAKLGTTLHLPEGWSFRTRTLKKNAYLTPVNKQAVVLQDEFLNTYQLETPDFIAQDK